MKNNLKKFATLLTTLTLVVVLGVCLSACGNNKSTSNAELNAYEARLQEGGYTAAQIKSYKGDALKGNISLPEGFTLNDFDWVIIANNSETSAVYIFSLVNEDKAIEYAAFMQKKNEEVATSTIVVERNGKIVFGGSQEAVDIARGK